MRRAEQYSQAPQTGRCSLASDLEPATRGPKRTWGRQTACPLGFPQGPGRTTARSAKTTSSTGKTAPTGRPAVAPGSAKLARKDEPTAHCHSLIAILVITITVPGILGLPLFVAGSHVTAEMVVETLRVVLPANLQFLISDRGTHFAAMCFNSSPKMPILSTWSLPVTVHNRMELPSDLFVLLKSGWLTKPGFRTKSYRNFCSCFCRNTTTAHTRAYLPRACLPMNMPNASGLCNPKCSTFI